MNTDELRRLIRGEFGDRKSVDALVDQLGVAGREAAALIRARLSSDDEARALANLAWEEIQSDLPKQKSVKRQTQEKLQDGLRKLNAFLEEALERSASNNQN